VNYLQEQKIMGGRFVLSIKDVGTPREVYKARYVVQGFRDRDKTYLVHQPMTARQQSTKLLGAMAAIFGFRIFTHDVQQAHLQSADKLMRVVYISPSKEFELGSDVVLKLLKPLYGLCDSGDNWSKTLSDHLQNDFNMKSTTGDPAMFYKAVNDKIAGVTSAYVDDLLMAGTKEFEKETELTSQKFVSRKREYDQVRFAGTEIDKTGDGFIVHQREYCSKIPLLKPTSDFQEFSSIRARLSWATHTRPDICCAVNQAAQVTQSRFDEDPTTYVKDINKITKIYTP
jgi:hypothetical protein